MKFLLAKTWLLITFVEHNGVEYEYLLEDKARNTYIALTTEKPLSGKSRQWVRVKGEVECETVDATTGGDYVTHRFCNSTQLVDDPCKQFFWIGKVAYCNEN